MSPRVRLDQALLERIAEETEKSVQYVREQVSRRARIRWFGLAALMVAAGVAIAFAITGTPGHVLGFVSIAIGLVLATSLVFLEVGLSEDRDRARERELASRKSRPGRSWRPSLGRSRGHRRRLR